MRTISPCQGHSSGAATNPARTGILAHILPLLSITLAAANQIIKKTFCQCGGGAIILRDKCVSEGAYIGREQDPAQCNEKVNVIRHDHVSADGYAADYTCFGETNDFVVNCFIRE
jgi:hypothetical protein